jgi:hypothetical protein
VSRDLKGAAIQCDDAEFGDLARTVLERGLTLRFRARGISMRPLLKDQDVLHVRPVAHRSIAVGDVVLYISARDQVVVHRVLRRLRTAEGMNYQIKGDRVDRADGIVPHGAVLGQVVARERSGRSVDLTGVTWQVIGLLAAYASPGSYLLRPVERLVARIREKAWYRPRNRCAQTGK